ncbi:MAG TPA: adenylate/guanylate cyclase domain-containing protein [Actinomycetota bacterium]|nr:adenylate/guanylate cyclase domain-containing protein [Actinomycetota bacterium]
MEASPEVRYAKTVDGVHIAYQVLGEGPPDIVLVGWLTGLDYIWRWPRSAAYFRMIAANGRLIMLDRRGTGQSDHATEAARAKDLDARMDDIRAVMDAAGSERAVLFGIEDGFALAALFASTYPERTAALIAYAATARTAWAPDYPFGQTPESFEEDIASIERGWGTRELAEEWMPYVFPDDLGDEETMAAFAAWMRSGGGPGDAAEWYRVDAELDVRHLLPAIHAPTLILHRVGDRSVPIEHGRYLAEHIPGATIAELPGEEHAWRAKDDVALAIGDFLRQLRQEEAEFDRVLASVLFTDIVGSTERAAALGDTAWRDLVERHHALVRGMLVRYRGREMDTAGDGFFAAFDGPARAVRCAQAIVEGVGALGIEVRAGVHTGEVETIDGKVGGIAVAIGARVASKAGSSQVLVSQTVRDLVAGSGLVFEDAGEHELKGVPDRWHLYRVVS